MSYCRKIINLVSKMITEDLKHFVEEAKFSKAFAISSETNKRKSQKRNLHLCFLQDSCSKQLNEQICTCQIRSPTLKPISKINPASIMGFINSYIILSHLIHHLLPFSLAGFPEVRLQFSIQSGVILNFLPLPFLFFMFAGVLQLSFILPIYCCQILRTWLSTSFLLSTGASMG